LLTAVYWWLLFASRCDVCRRRLGRRRTALAGSRYGHIECLVTLDQT
jgi:hypothetical protein